jgi:hypothetical protein
MTEPEKRPMNPQTGDQEDQVKKIPMPSLEKEFFDMITEHKRYKEQTNR